MGHAVQLQRMEARLAREDFPYRARRGIAVEYALDVFTNASEHRRIENKVEERQSIIPDPPYQPFSP
jgi:hypothetical protein